MTYSSKPIDDLIRSTTLPATQTGLRFSSELCFEIVFTDPGDSIVKVATVFKQDVALASFVLVPLPLQKKTG